MNITIYIALIIILLLIILFISLKYYLINTHSTYIEIDDNGYIEDRCLYDHDYNIQYCNYVVDGKKYIITELFINELKNNKSMTTFNAENFDLPPNGKLKLRYICDSCNGVDRTILDDKGNPIDKNGNFTNDDGNPIDANGNLIDKNGNPIDADGNPISNKNKFANANAIQNEYNLMTEDYVADRANYNKKIYKDSPNAFIPVHSTSTQNSAYWNGENNSYDEQLHNMLNPINRYADLISMEKRINISIGNNDIDSTLYDIEKLENSMARDFTNDSPMSYVSNIFNRKYPKNSNTSILANIDPEYIHGGLRGDAKLLN
uniref:Uncharacterized protein n=1 Tax=viral metagenome TaxID=1070528 RepID=A0A6C0I120_9ZZZZ